MAIKSIFVKNFRGISDGINLPIRPITLFIGANSSGKSTIIHSLATLSQTVKLPNDSRPLILDDEFGSVHLGRFIEVIHSKSYNDSISLGVNFDGTDIPVLKDGKVEFNKAAVGMCMDFRSTTRTQKVFVEKGVVTADKSKYNIKLKKSSAKEALPQYEVSKEGEAEQLTVRMKSGFTLDDNDFLVRQKPGNYEIWWPLLMAQRHISQQLERVCYLGPFRQPPLRQYPTRGASPIEVGSQGESTATMLANEVMRSQNRTHITEISKWLQTLGVGKKLNVQRVASSDMFDLDVTLLDDESFAIADLGYGLSQVLPVLTQCSFAAKGSILLFEQPELHLHSLAVRPLASIFIDAMRRKELTILAETHSCELLGQFQRELRAKTIQLEELIIYRVHRESGHTVINEIQIDSDDFDIFENWEKGISIP